MLYPSRFSTRFPSILRPQETATTLRHATNGLEILKPQPPQPTATLQFNTRPSEDHDKEVHIAHSSYVYPLSNSREGWRIFRFRSQGIMIILASQFRSKLCRQHIKIHYACYIYYYKVKAL